MKEVKWINNNKMLFESLHKTFNKQVRLISTGNAIFGTQLSKYIRPISEITCNGAPFPVGHLRNYDLDYMEFPQHIRIYLNENHLDTKLIAYHFFYHNNKHQRIDIGWVITDENHKLIKKWYARTTDKIISALDECIKYITEE